MGDSPVYNVYIFNKIQNNDADVELLIQTFQSLECSIAAVVTNSTLDELKSVVWGIIASDYSNFNYLVIIVLDNTNEEDSIWITTDSLNFHINGDLLTAIYANRSLMGKLRFSIIQNNRTLTDAPPILRRAIGQTSYPGNDLKYFATSTGCRLQHNWSEGALSPFIRILCEEISLRGDPTERRPISEMLDTVSTRIDTLTNELPAKEKNFTEPVVLGRATL